MRARGGAGAASAPAGLHPLARLRAGVGEKLRASRNVASMAHAVEELVANALDAEARAVAVTVDPREGFVRVEDNGCGMARAELERAGRAFSTSKVSAQEAADLVRDGAAPTRSRGFRGDALHALSHLGSVEIVSRPWTTPNSAREGGIQTLGKHCARGRSGPVQAASALVTPGTRVTVSEIFKDVPVRRLRLAESARETVGQIRRLLERNALGAPHCAFTLSEGVPVDAGASAAASGPPKLVWKSPGGRSTRDVFGKLFGDNIGGALVDRSLATPELRLEALVSPASAGAMQTSTRLQFIFVNGRPVPRVRRIEGLVNRLYRAHFDRLGAPVAGPCFPAFVLSIECEPTEVDVLWEPSKAVVEFNEWRRLLRGVEALLRGIFADAHEEAAALGDEADNTQDSFASRATSSSSSSSASSSRYFAAIAAAVLDDPGPPDPPGEARRKRSKSDDGEEDDAEDAWRAFRLKRRRGGPAAGLFDAEVDEAPAEQARTLEGVSLTREALAQCKVIAQVGAKFIFVQHEDQVLCVDQHAADERVRLEAFEDSLADRLGSSYVTKHMLEAPERVRLMPDRGALLEELREHFEAWGFAWRADAFDTGAMVLESAPAVFGVPLGASALMEILDLAEKSPSLVANLLPPPIRSAAVSRACRGAIKFGDDLTHEQCVALVRKLSRCKFPFQCAHGRPSCVPLAGIVRGAALGEASACAPAARRRKCMYMTERN